MKSGSWYTYYFGLAYFIQYYECRLVPLTTFLHLKFPVYQINSINTPLMNILLIPFDILNRILVNSVYLCHFRKNQLSARKIFIKILACCLINIYI